MINMSRKNVFIFINFILFLFCFSTSFAAGSESNLLQDPGFESFTGDMPLSWSEIAWNKGSEFTEFAPSNSVFHGGKVSAMIYNKKENDARYCYKTKVEGSSVYRVSCWIKTENVGGGSKGANISIEGMQDTSVDIKGTTDWTLAQLYLRTGKDADEVTVTLGVGGYSSLNTGKAFFDDVEVVKTDSVPSGAPVANIGQTAQKNSSDDKGDSGEKTYTSTPEQNSEALDCMIIILLFLSSGALVYGIGYIMIDKGMISDKEDSKMKPELGFGDEKINIENYKMKDLI